MKFHEVTEFKVMPYYNKKMTIINKEDKPVRFQIPKLLMPFGISGFVPPSGPTRWNIDFALKGYQEEGNYVKSFYEFLESFEKRVIHEVSQQSQEIFGRTICEEELECMFNSNLKKDPSGRWEPKFRVKISDDDPLFNECDLQIDEPFVDNLYRKYSGLAIVEPTSVYFMQKRFGITWKIHQLKIYEPQMLKGFAFRDVPTPSV